MKVYHWNRLGLTYIKLGDRDNDLDEYYIGLMLNRFIAYFNRVIESSWGLLWIFFGCDDERLLLILLMVYDVVYDNDFRVIFVFFEFGRNRYSKSCVEKHELIHLINNHYPLKL